MACSGIPYGKEQGIILPEQGIFTREQGKIIAGRHFRYPHPTPIHKRDAPNLRATRAFPPVASRGSHTQAINAPTPIGPFGVRLTQMLAILGRRVV